LGVVLIEVLRLIWWLCTQKKKLPLLDAKCDLANQEAGSLTERSELFDFTGIYDL
jgi:hypothetical protein